MKQKLSVNKNRELPAYYLFFIGCVIGIVLPNLIYKMQWKQNTVSALYLMGIYAEKGSREYFWKVLRMRGGLFLLVAGSGLTIFGVLVAVGGMILLGIGMGMLMTMSISSAPLRMASSASNTLVRVVAYPVGKPMTVHTPTLSARSAMYALHAAT